MDRRSFLKGIGAGIGLTIVPMPIMVFIPKEPLQGSLIARLLIKNGIVNPNFLPMIWETFEMESPLSILLKGVNNERM